MNQNNSFQARFNHVNQRAIQRYGTELTIDEQAEIGKLIRHFERIARKKCINLVKTDFVEKVTNYSMNNKLVGNRDAYCVHYKDKQWYCVYDHTDNMVVTVLERYMLKNSLRLTPMFRGIVVERNPKRNKDWKYINHKLKQYRTHTLRIKKGLEVYNIPLERQIAYQVDIGQEVAVDTIMGEILPIETKPAQKARNLTEIYSSPENINKLAKEAYDICTRKVEKRCKLQCNYAVVEVECSELVWEKVLEQLEFDGFKVIVRMQHEYDYCKRIKISW